MRKCTQFWRSWKQRIIEENLLHPQVIYGYFPCQAEGNSLYVYDPEAAKIAKDDRGQELQVSIFPGKSL